MAKIKGGYYIKARKIQESEIAHASPYVREIWDWLLKECNHKDKKVGNRTIHRGQCVRSFRDIQNGLSWKVGYRTERYKKWQCEKSMKWLTRATMIATTKTTRGLVITILNYDFYQDPKNYDSNTDSYNGATMEQQLTATINKNDKNVKNEKKEDSVRKKRPFVVDNPPTEQDGYLYLLGYSNEKGLGFSPERIKKIAMVWYNHYSSKDNNWTYMAGNTKRTKMIDWKAKCRQWILKEKK